MKLAYRTLVFIVSIIFMFSSLVLAFYAFGFAETNYLPGIIEGFYGQWEYGILFLLVFIAGASIIYPFFAVNEKDKKTLISNNELGDVNITLGAIDNLIKKVILQRDGIESMETYLKSNENGLNVKLKIKIYSDYIIPDLTDELQKVVKSYLEDTTGVTVNQVNILVNKIKNSEVRENE